MAENYIQLYNAVEQPFFVGMESGKAMWLISDRKLHLLVFAAHPTEDGKFYYEDLRTQETSWSLPLTEMTASAANTAKVLTTFNAEESEVWIGDSFPYDESALLTIAIDAYLLGESGDYDESDQGSEEAELVKTPEVTPVASPDAKPTQTSVLNEIVSAKSTDLLKSKSPSKDESDDEEEDKVKSGAVSGTAHPRDADDSDEESSAGGTASSDGEDDDTQSTPIKASAAPVDMSILTNDLIHHSNTIKVGSISLPRVFVCQFTAPSVFPCPRRAT